MKKADRRAAICGELVRLIADERKRVKCSKNKLAYLTGLNQSTVSRLENYHDNPTMDSLLRVADALELNLGEILKQAIQNVDKEGR
ncbi:MAG: helix-turn-helix transcriptional regulator [Negativicutes bacterium]|nr:helix-turn-helix transcriptional regulator [Negativicutes bacterium]